MVVLVHAQILGGQVEKLILVVELQITQRIFLMGQLGQLVVHFLTLKTEGRGVVG
jgi:hypothetical protein